MLMNHRGNRQRRGGFTLTETTLAIGIVATVALPLLAILARSGSMETSARDHETSAEIAKHLRSGIRSGRPGELFIVAGDHDPIRLQQTTGTYLAVDAEGAVLREISVEEHRSGLSYDTGAFSVVEIRLTASAAGSTNTPDLLELDLVVEHPAAAAAESRSRERFQSRISAP